MASVLKFEGSRLASASGPIASHERLGEGRRNPNQQWYTQNKGGGLFGLFAGHICGLSLSSRA